MARRFGAWIRYGDPVTQVQLEFAAVHYRAAVLQPWEVDAAAWLKDARPDMTVLAYACLSSTRSYEPGPVYSSGVSFEEAEEAGEHWFAHRLDGSRIQWSGYPGHWAMSTWDPDYRHRWCDNIADSLEDSPFDGVMADNDIYDDYYALDPPLEGGRTMQDLRDALGLLVAAAGTRLNTMSRVLIPNIAESRREPGRWARHAAYGGGFEEVWLAWSPTDFLDPRTALAQMDELTGQGLTIVRVATDGTDNHPNVRYGLAAFWVFGGGGDCAFAATGHDAYSGTPYVAELDWDLGQPVEEPQQRGNGWSRGFTGGWAVVNLNDRRRRSITYAVPPGLQDAQGRPAPRRLTIEPHHGVVLRRS